MANASNDGNRSQKRQRTGTLTDLDAIECPVCFDTLTIPVFQCENGHMTCAHCCEKLRKVCATCKIPSVIRNRGIERVLELLKVPCPNSEFGCSEEVIYNEKSAHLEQCVFAECACPFKKCDFTGSYKDLYEHSVAKHTTCLYYHYSLLEEFECGKLMYPTLSAGSRLILKEQGKEGGGLVVVDCFRSPVGVIISVSCIAPKIAGLGEFSCILTADSCPNCDLCFKHNIKRVFKVIDRPPEEHFMVVPSCMHYHGKIKLCINRRPSNDQEGASTSSA